MAQLGANAHGEVLVFGRVPDCYPGLILDLSSTAEAPKVLVVVTPAAPLRLVSYGRTLPSVDARL